jgi:hypothetical protein
MNPIRTATDMKLTPRDPPGRSNRKARAFEVEIARLRRDGYSCDAIREALADAGVNVSKSTVQREVARPSGPGLPAARHGSVAALDHAAPTSSAPQMPASLLPADELRSGKDIAEAFVRSRITNPLIRSRSRDEDRRH